MNARQGFAAGGAAAEVEGGDFLNRAGLQEIIDKVGVGNQAAVVGKCAVGQGLHQFLIRVLAVGQKAGFERGGHEGFEVAVGVAGVGIFCGDHFALLGDADLAGYAAGGLGEHGLVSGAAATADAAAAAVKQADVDLVFFKQFHQFLFGLIKTP